MNRLQQELRRLYLVPSGTPADADAAPATLVDASGRVRALVIELARPPGWEVLARVWHGVQTELGLPAPAVAVSGLDGLQLWLSLAEPITAAQAHAFLECLRQRFLPDVERSRVRLMPAPDAAAPGRVRHALLVPARQEETGNWSAFLAPDLVPVFADSPWLDVAPNEEGQASLLHGVEVMPRDVFDGAFERLAPNRDPAPSTLAGGAAGVGGAPAPHPADGDSPGDDAERFLLQVMHDDTVAMALRVDAAKALLQHAGDLRAQGRD